MQTNLNLTIRRMDLSDLPEVLAIERLSFSTPWPESSYLYDLNENENACLWVAEVADLENQGKRRIAGMIVLWLILDETHIGNIAVHPDLRRQQIGRSLLETALQDAKKQGAIRAFLEVRRGNLAAQTLYERMGFEVVGVRKHYYKDNGEDALLLTLEMQSSYGENNRVCL